MLLISDFGISSKGLTWINSVLAWNIAWNWRKKAQNIKKIGSIFWTGDKGKTTSFKWFFQVRSSVLFFEDVKHLGCQAVNKTNENMNWVKEFVLKNRRITILEFASMLGIAIGSVQSILKHQLYMLRLATNYVPHACHTVLSVHEIKWLSYSSYLLTRSSALGLPLFPKIMMDWKGNKFLYSCHHDPTKILGHLSNCKPCTSQNSSNSGAIAWLAAWSPKQTIQNGTTSVGRCH